ncbi:hypothetical protein V8E53_000901 [Lactarius tabidus]
MISHCFESVVFCLCSLFFDTASNFLPIYLCVHPLDLTFSVEGDEFGVTKIVPLKENARVTPFPLLSRYFARRYSLALVSFRPYVHSSY